MRSSVVYQYTCPKCNLGTYVGSTHRMLRVRMSEHFGVSYRSLLPLSTQEKSPILLHSKKCKTKLNFNHFKILNQARDSQSLLILESLQIKNLSPRLNSDTSASKLLIS